jgi:hypothetical protein
MHPDHPRRGCVRWRRPPRRSRRSKTDQEGAGDTIAIVSGSLACPVKAVRAWLEASKVTAGPLFRQIFKGGRIGTERLADHTVVRVVKASARRVGLDPNLFAGHSLRSGFLTSAAGRGGGSAHGGKSRDRAPRKTVRLGQRTMCAARRAPRTRPQGRHCPANWSARSDDSAATCQCQEN